MKSTYTPDNTRSSILILLTLAAIVTGVAAVVGLSAKPDVTTIVIAPGSDANTTIPTVAASTTNFGFDIEADPDDAMLDEAGEPFDDLEAEATGATTPEGEIIVIPSSEPTATPEVAAAVEPTPVPDESGDSADAAGAVQAAPTLPATAGTVQGTFFTKGDESDGATVSQNLITISYAQDGSGGFQGVLDITYADDTHILLNMSGPITWATTNPQVEATLAGAFTLDAPIDADDVTADDAKLSISTLEAGSGSLCTTKCFGFTFTPP